MEKLTIKQAKILEFIKTFSADRGYMPTVRDIAGAFGVSIGTVQGHLKALVTKGCLSRARGLSRGIDFASRQPLKAIPVLGQVHAGSLAEAIENVEDYIHLDKRIVSGGDYFALRVKGDSMTGSGIHEGDLIVVRKQATAEDGEIVVALVADGAAVKKLRKKNGATWLESTNPRYKPIGAKEITILGKVVYLTRALA